MYSKLTSRLLVCILLLSQYMHAVMPGENFIVLNGASDEVLIEIGNHINEQIPPACTFNIALSLMGYDSVVLIDNQKPVLDFHEGYDAFLESWKANLSPLEWMSRSAVWYSKLLAIELGTAKIQHYLGLFDYGNQDFSGGLAVPGPLKPAWEVSSLKISPKEQAIFAQKVVCKTLPVSNHAYDITRKLLFREELPNDWKLFGKTGMGTLIDDDGRNVSSDVTSRLFSCDKLLQS